MHELAYMYGRPALMTKLNVLIIISSITIIIIIMIIKEIGPTVTHFVYSIIYIFKLI